MSFLSRVYVLLIAMLVGAPVLAASVPIELNPIKHNRAELTVAGPMGERAYTPQELEQLGARRLTTITPWRPKPAAFDGVLLSDLLRANGLWDAEEIHVVAENGYSVTLKSEDWKRWPILIATRVNGKPHTRRERGPIQFVMSMSDHRETGREEHLVKWVWMAKRIEIAQ